MNPRPSPWIPLLTAGLLLTIHAPIAAQNPARAAVAGATPSRPTKSLAAQTLVCFGDSITAGYGLDQDQAYPAQLENLLRAKGYPVHVVNQGVSGNTTKDAVARLPSILALHPEVALVEFGGNDGLRGLPVAVTRQNLLQVVTTLQQAHIRVLLAGITLPPNYGPGYIHDFQQVFQEVARQRHLRSIPDLYAPIERKSGTIQADGIHPTALGSAMLARSLLPAVEPLLRK